MEKQRKKRILILSSTLGNGHMEASLAIQEALLHLSADVKVDIVDYLGVASPYINKISKYFWHTITPSYPHLFKWTYQSTKSSHSWLQQQLNHIGVNSLENILQKYRPTLVLSTFPTSATAMGYYKAQKNLSLPLATLITDHAVHPQWKSEGTDMYFVGSDCVGQGVSEWGKPYTKVFTTGIPLRKKFLQEFDRDALQEKHQLDKKIPKLLLLASGYPLMDVRILMNRLTQGEKPLQLIIVCGRNASLCRDLKKHVNENENIKVYGYVDFLPELLACVDLVITKAGGLTITGLLALQTPMIIYKPLPGQEMENTHYLLRNNAAVHATKVEEVFSYVHAFLFSSPEKRLEMKKQAAEISKPNAAAEIASFLLGAKHS